MLSNTNDPFAISENYQSKLLLANITSKLYDLTEEDLKLLMIACNNEIERKKQFERSMNCNFTNY